MPDFARSADRTSSAAPRLAPRGRSAHQPRPDLADQLDRVTPRLDDLTQRARLGYTQAQFDDMEEDAQGIADAIMAPFRGDRRGRTA